MCERNISTSFRMEGKGEYVFPTGTKYVGDMRDGMWVYQQPHMHIVYIYTLKRFDKSPDDINI